MAEILVTGGTGVLGRQLVPKLQAAGHSVRVLSRRAGARVPVGVALFHGEMATGEGLSQAVAGTQSIVHCATSPLRHLRQVDVEGTKRLLEAADRAGCGHVVYISIVGIDRVPYPYYKVKLEAEGAIEASGLPFTILRATQFHHLILQFFRKAERAGFLFLPKGFVFQPVETEEVAERLAELVAAGPSARVPDTGGPEVRSIGDLARTYVDITASRARLVRLPVPGKSGRGFRAGLHTCPDHADGTVTWEQFLRRRSDPPATL